MISVPVHNQEGKDVGKTTLSDKLFAVKVNPGLVQEVVTAYLASHRQSAAHTKTKAEVRGGGKKPWRQKGTGRARHGSIRSPLWRGGGITFGPRNVANYSKKVNVKARKKALMMVLSDKVANKKFVVLDQLSLKEPKTKLFAHVLSKLPKLRSQLVVLSKDPAIAIRASRNIPTVDLVAPKHLHAYDVLSHDGIVITKDAVKILESYLETR